eukprot:11429073-Alexandrium_andersonii.AAC.1
MKHVQNKKTQKHEKTCLPESVATPKFAVLVFPEICFSAAAGPFSLKSGARPGTQCVHTPPSHCQHLYGYAWSAQPCRFHTCGQ